MLKQIKMAFLRLSFKFIVTFINAQLVDSLKLSGCLLSHLLSSLLAWQPNDHVVQLLLVQVEHLIQSGSNRAKMRFRKLVRIFLYWVWYLSHPILPGTIVNKSQFCPGRRAEQSPAPPAPAGGPPPIPTTSGVGTESDGSEGEGAFLQNHFQDVGLGRLALCLLVWRASPSLPRPGCLFWTMTDI